MKLIEVFSDLVSANVRHQEPNGAPDTFAEFLNTFPVDRIEKLTLDGYCLGARGNGEMKSFSWWLEHGLQPALGSYAPGTAKGHLLYWQKDGTLYKNRHLEKLSDVDALNAVLRLHAHVASTRTLDEARSLDDQQALEGGLALPPGFSMSDGRVLRLLAAYHPEFSLPIYSQKHLPYFLECFGIERDEMATGAVARMLQLFGVYDAVREHVPDVTPWGFVNTLYKAGEQLEIRPPRTSHAYAGSGRKKAESSAVPTGQGDASDDTQRGAEQQPPLNQILVGPPGTGKTRHTILKALEIIEPDLFEEHNPDSPDGFRSLKERFDELRDEQRIRFVTFHQSFSYEDFVEGLRMSISESKDDLDDAEGATSELRPEAGVFKQIATLASNDAMRESVGDGIALSGRVWKISLNGTQFNSVKEWCFANGQARIGWNRAGDLHNQQPEEVEYFKQLGRNEKKSLTYFSQEIQVGDMLLSIDSNTSVDAVGIVQKPYFYDPAPFERFPQAIEVRWIARGSIPFQSLNGGKLFALSTVSPMHRMSQSSVVKHLAAQQVSIEQIGQKRQRRPYVLIIDEINRGNVSRIFGELITLLEPSKREGAAGETQQVILPYSKAPFTVPDNLYIVGTMNTADRSLVPLDTALRRRFHFEELMPDASVLSGITVEEEINIAKMFSVMNERITALLGRERTLGHSYFLPLRDDQSIGALSRIFSKQIIPLLQEYFFNDWQRIQWVLKDQKKKPEHRFVIDGFPSHGQDLGKLFGDDAVAQALGEIRHWTVNEAAFNERESYLGIYDKDHA
ncbi:AAA family ATPase [Paraburkholderia sp. GAS82]|uniref:AAA family ATPase n=1 Tax=Paraburkholderia sp. GAS82 TaxID=3035137 RepID=UPI003D1D1234